MRLKLLTNLNTLLLVAVCLALGATLWWSQRALERPYVLMERYLGLSQAFQNQTARNIDDYLASGDALRLSAAGQSLESLALNLDELPPELSENCAPACWTLRVSARPTCWPPASWPATHKPCCCKPSGSWGQSGATEPVRHRRQLTGRGALSTTVARRRAASGAAIPGAGQTGEQWAQRAGGRCGA